MDVTDLAGEVVDPGVAGGDVTGRHIYRRRSRRGRWRTHSGVAGTCTWRLWHLRCGNCDRVVALAVDTTEPSLLLQILTFCSLPQRWSVVA